MKCYRIFFSPTGGTKKVAERLSNGWEGGWQDVDLCDESYRFEDLSFEDSDLCLVAVPSFGGRVPSLAVSRLNRLNGRNAKAVPVVVYGNRAYDDTLLELRDTLSKANFICAAAISAVAEHSIMHQFGAGRPDTQDEKELDGFAERLRNHLNHPVKNSVSVPGNRPYREYNGVPFKPKAGKGCNQCGLCASVCPACAIPKDAPSTTDTEKCISCMRCVSICPSHARDLNKMLLFAASQKMKAACAERKANELILSE